MDEREIHRQLIEWMINFVEKPNKLLNDWAPCPYARQARLSGKVFVVFKESDRNLDSLITSNLYKLETFDVIVFCIDHTEISASKLAERVEILNQLLIPKDYVLLEDHPDNKEELNGVVMNFGHCALVLAQKFSKLDDASKQLREKGYYDNWPKENLDYVVNWRNK